jgi:prolycopene isomerase
MTTIPLARDMAAGEVLWIARHNLQAMRQVLSSGYPIGGMGALTQGLVQVIESAGGEVRCQTPVHSVVIEKGRALGVRVVAGRSEYPADFRISETSFLRAERVVLALPIYQLEAILDFQPDSSPLPEWWRKRIDAIKHEITGLIGYVLGLREPVVQGLCFLSALKCQHTGRPFQGFPASNFDPSAAPAGKQVLYTDCVIEYPEVSNPFERERQLKAMWQDLREMFPGFEDKLEWSLPYYVAGCDGLARKPGLVGRFKPELKAPGIENLYFAGDTYQGRGLAMNSAALSALQAADLILADLNRGKA